MNEYHKCLWYPPWREGTGGQEKRVAQGAWLRLEISRSHGITPVSLPIEHPLLVTWQCVLNLISQAKAHRWLD